MPEITIKDGKVSAVSYVQCTRDHLCDCGAKFTITMNWPESVICNGSITVKNTACPTCGEKVVIPHGKHYVENFKLLTKSVS